MKAEDLRKKAVIEATNFNSALDKIDAEDKQTYAISSRDGVMVRDATGKGQRLDMSTYVSNVDKFKVMTINESEWKKNETQLFKLICLMNFERERSWL
jgi:hypothetical protein